LIHQAARQRRSLFRSPQRPQGFDAQHGGFLAEHPKDALTLSLPKFVQGAPRIAAAQCCAYRVEGAYFVR
jgi:hypothetical protein